MKWIPCSERLPEIYEEVLVCTVYGDQYVWNLTDGDGSYMWEDEYGYWQCFESVIAWMPLPKPYKEKIEVCGVTGNECTKCSPGPCQSRKVEKNE